jgi:nucleotide-binding universal stress UspA family protein
VQHYILVALDGSTFSEAIVPHAMALAQATESALLLMQVLEPVYEPIFGALGMPALEEEEQVAQMREEQLASLHHYLETLANHLRAEGLEIHTKVIEGNHPATEIRWLAEHDTLLQMSAMTTHGRSGVLRWLFGSVAAEVVHTTPRPLLLLRPHESDRSSSTGNCKAVAYQTIVVPLDASPFAEQALDQAYELASAMKATLHLVSIVAPPHVLPFQREKEPDAWLRAVHQTEVERRTHYLEEKAEPFRVQGVQVQTEVASGHPAEEILRLSTQHQHMLLVMTTHGRTGFRRLLLGSVAMKVVQGAHVPLLLVPGRSS